MFVHDNDTSPATNCFYCAALAWCRVSSIFRAKHHSHTWDTSVLTSLYHQTNGISSKNFNCNYSHNPDLKHIKWMLAAMAHKRELTWKCWDTRKTPLSRLAQCHWLGLFVWTSLALICGHTYWSISWIHFFQLSWWNVQKKRWGKWCFLELFRSFCKIDVFTLMAWEEDVSSSSI